VEVELGRRRCASDIDAVLGLTISDFGAVGLVGYCVEFLLWIVDGVEEGGG
jgi:hypothetical protein